MIPEFISLWQKKLLVFIFHPHRLSLPQFSLLCTPECQKESVNLCNLARGPTLVLIDAHDIQHEMLLCIVFPSTPLFVSAPLYEDHAGMVPSLLPWNDFCLFPFSSEEVKREGLRELRRMEKGRDRAATTHGKFRI